MVLICVVVVLLICVVVVSLLPYEERGGWGCVVSVCGEPMSQEGGGGGAFLVILCRSTCKLARYKYFNGFTNSVTSCAESLYQNYLEFLSMLLTIVTHVYKEFQDDPYKSETTMETFLRRCLKTCSRYICSRVWWLAL